MSISVMYITNRYGGMDILKSSLNRQQFKDFELVIVDGLYEERKEQVKEYFKDVTYPVKHLKEIELEPEKGYKAKLARCINQGFSNCEGDLIVSLQDYIYVPKEGLANFWAIHQFNSNALVTGISHQYYYPEKDEIVNEKGLITIFGEDFTKKPDIRFWTDPRPTGNGSLREAQPVEWELNWASIPNKVVKDLGGCDAEYDLHGFGYDNTNLATRAAFVGYPIYLHPTNEVFCFNHDGWWENKYKKEGIQPHEFHIQQMSRMFKGEIPARLNYLTENSIG